MLWSIFYITTNSWNHDVFLTSRWTFLRYDLFFTLLRIFDVMMWFWRHDIFFDVMTYFWRHDVFLMSWHIFDMPLTPWCNLYVMTYFLTLWCNFDVIMYFLTSRHDLTRIKQKVKITLRLAFIAVLHKRINTEASEANMDVFWDSSDEVTSGSPDEVIGRARDDHWIADTAPVTAETLSCVFRLSRRTVIHAHPHVLSGRRRRHHKEIYEIRPVIWADEVVIGQIEVPTIVRHSDRPINFLLSGQSLPIGALNLKRRRHFSKAGWESNIQRFECSFKTCMHIWPDIWAIFGIICLLLLYVISQIYVTCILW